MDIIKNVLLKYKLIILSILILLFIGSCHCIKPTILNKVTLSNVNNDNHRV